MDSFQPVRLKYTYRRINSGQRSTLAAFHPIMNFFKCSTRQPASNPAIFTMNLMITTKTLSSTATTHFPHNGLIPKSTLHPNPKAKIDLESNQLKKEKKRFENYNLFFFQLRVILAFLLSKFCEMD